jgi:uncharacterized protein (TIGR03435 family)
MGNTEIARRPLRGAPALLAVAVPVVLGVICGAQLSAQVLHASGPLPSFEVASIRPNDSGSGRSQLGAAGVGAPMDRFIVTNTTIKQLICWAFGGTGLPLPSDQVSGGPGWINSDRYDIDAKLDESQAAALPKLSGSDRIVQIRLMVQSLLADRFKLVVSDKMVPRPVYALVVAKGGPKLQETVPGSPSQIKIGGNPTQAYFSAGDIRAHGIQVSMLARSLSNQGELGRPVLDETGLKGSYDIDLKWTPEVNPPGAMPGPSPAAEVAPPDASGPSIFAALQEQLGLKLESTTGAVEALEIVHIEKPSEN